MDSINKNQPEDNIDNLTGPEAIEKLKELASGTCFFCTKVKTSNSDGARPMSVQKVDDDGSLWFLSAIDSHKNLELAENPEVELFFQGSPHSDFLRLTGTATISQDRAKIDELWNPIIKTWFTEGKDDPRITVIRVKPTDGYYWDTKHGNLVAGIKILIGAATGKTLDDSIEGTVRV
ncbi:MAG TPA: pyridoxamine 5'-phosphate oxidase family protein [Fimbriimonadaceae bacterium]|nr:pyridoxamine 5'-phosphate oxidase family protein [Fimbriimonadaceae bacterium]